MFKKGNGVQTATKHKPQPITQNTQSENTKNTVKQTNWGKQRAERDKRHAHRQTNDRQTSEKERAKRDKPTHRRTDRLEDATNKQQTGRNTARQNIKTNRHVRNISSTCISVEV